MGLLEAVSALPSVTVGFLETFFFLKTFLRVSAVCALGAAASVTSRGPLAATPTPWLGVGQGEASPELGFTSGGLTVVSQSCRRQLPRLSH